jgi:hypothetical protein
MTFGEPGADWLLLGPDVRHRHTTYDLDEAGGRPRGSGYLGADEFVARYVLHPPSEAEMLAAFAKRA